MVFGLFGFNMNTKLLGSLATLVRFASLRAGFASLRSGISFIFKYFSVSFWFAESCLKLAHMIMMGLSMPVCGRIFDFSFFLHFIGDFKVKFRLFGQKFDLFSRQKRQKK